MKDRFFIFILVVVSALIFSACHDDESLSQNKVVNNWIFDTMDEVYLWTDQMPQDESRMQDPIDFFHALLYSGDRFSAIVENYSDLINSLNGIELEAGYEFALLRSGETDVVALITYVKPNSPAADAGLKRGYLISKINGQVMTIDNYQSLIGEISSNHSLTYSIYDENEQAFVEQPELQLSVVQYSENPIFLDTVYTVDSKKIGYFVYNFFSDGGQGFDNQVKQAFQEFKSDNITDFVLDLRYNSGGSVVSATNLASLLAPGVTSNDVFYTNQWNNLYQDYWESQPDGDQQLKGFFVDQANNIGTEINANVYILTGSRTASASELIINGLAPYMNVTIVGDTTIGKNVGSIPIEDEDNSDNTYGILPIVIRLANSDGFSDYENGFTPVGDNLVNDFSIPMLPLGSLDEHLLARAVELITGVSQGGRKQGKMAQKQMKDIGSSIDRHLRSNKAVLKSPKLK